MAKEELLEFDGTVTEVLPDGNFRVKLDNDHEILAYTAGKMRKFRIRTGVGDRVVVEMSPYDLQRGRISFRHKSAAPPMIGSGQRRPQYRRLGKLNAEAILAAPSHAAGVMLAGRLEHQIELLRNGREALDREQRAKCRQISHRAVDDPSARLHDDLSGLQGPVPWNSPPFLHDRLRFRRS